MARTTTSFKPGHPRFGGRQRGTKNRATLEIKEFARRLLEDPEYEASLRERILKGQAAHMEVLLWHYLAGRPIERVEGTVRLPLQIVHRTLRLGEDPLADPEESTALPPAQPDPEGYVPVRGVF